MERAPCKVRHPVACKLQARQAGSQLRTCGVHLVQQLVAGALLGPVPPPALTTSALTAACIPG